MTEILKNLPIHYRYNDCVHEKGLNITISRFYPVRETRCFYFVVNEYDAKAWVTNPKERRVSKDALRRYCYPTKKEALHSFKMRKKSQIWHAEFALAKASASLITLQDREKQLGEKDFDDISAGRPDYWDTLNFD